jgi:hypothetical protein
MQSKKPSWVHREHFIMNSNLEEHLSEEDEPLADADGMEFANRSQD